jgi:tetratricopeptide (TPR) repeat protein
LRVLLLLLAATIVLGGSASATHRFQVKRNAQSLLAQADQAEEEGQRAKAADYVWQYLGLMPRDNEALARYALLVEKQANAPREKLRVLLLCEQVLGRDDTRTDIRRVAARMAADLGLLKEGRTHLDALSTESPNDTPLLLLRARLEARGREFEAAAEAYAAVVERLPADLAVWREYLSVCRDGLKDLARAEEVVDEMIAANARSPEARAIAGRFFLGWGVAEKADEHIRLALAGEGKKDEDVLLLAAEVAGGRGQIEQARQHLRQGLQFHPRSTPLRLAAAQLEVRAKRIPEALALLVPLKRSLPEQVVYRWELGSLLADLGDTAGAGEVLTKLDGQGPERQWAYDLLSAQLLLRKRELNKARRQLEPLRSVAVPAVVGRPVDLMLAECYLALGSPDQAAHAARRVLAAIPHSQPGRALLAEALVASGKAEEAVGEYRQLAARAPGQGVRLARLLLRRQLRLPEKERNWKELEQVLDAVPAQQRQDAEVLLLRAEVLLAQGQAEQARKLAEEGRDRAPREPEAWLFLAELARRQGGAEKFLAVLDEAERRAGRRIEWTLARVRHWAVAGDDRARKQLQALPDDLDRWSQRDREQLLVPLGLALAQLGDQPRAEKLWRKIAAGQPAYLTSRVLLLEAAVDAKRAHEAKELADEIEKWEGAGEPTSCYARALFAARSGDRAALKEARWQLERAAARRPSWARLYSLQGDVEAQDGQREKAVQKYKLAIVRGETRLRVWRNLALLLFELRRYAEAAALLRRVPEQDRVSGGLEQLSAGVALVDPEEPDIKVRRKRALEVARKVAQAGKGDYRDHLWMGQLALLAGEPKEAEDALRKARQMAPEEPATWVALIALLARIDRDQARREVVEAEKALKKGRNALALVACQELVGQDSEAEKLAAQALHEQPGDPGVMAELAVFHVRNGRNAQAEKLWRQVLEPGTRAPQALLQAARRGLAVQLALKQAYPAHKEALALIEQNLEGSNAIEDRRTKALVLGMQPAQRSEAIRLFESLSPLAATTPPLMQLLLARLYEAEGQWPRARACLNALAQAEEKNPAVLRAAVWPLLRHGEVEEAGRLVEQLGEDQSPEATELRVRVLYACGKKEEALRLLDKYRADREERLPSVALVLESLGENEAAEKLLRRLAANPKQPGGLLLLAGHLARRKQTEAALRLCEQAWGRAQDETVAIMSLNVLRLCPVTDEQKHKTTEKIRAALERNRNALGLLLPLAELESKAGRYEQAMALYRRMLKVQPRNEMALNNLAFLLTLKEGKYEEALKLIEDLLEAVGPVAEALDTRGLIHLGAGRAEQAIRDFQAALRQDPAALKCFHLAQGQNAAGDRLAARAALVRARGKGLKEEAVPLLERPAFRALSKELGVP